jgi:hypothetical protein
MVATLFQGQINRFMKNSDCHVPDVLSLTLDKALSPASRTDPNQDDGLQTKRCQKSGPLSNGLLGGRITCITEAGNMLLFVFGRGTFEKVGSI